MKYYDCVRKGIGSWDYWDYWFWFMAAVLVLLILFLGFIRGNESKAKQSMVSFLTEHPEVSYQINSNGNHCDRFSIRNPILFSVCRECYVSYGDIIEFYVNGEKTSEIVLSNKFQSVYINGIIINIKWIGGGTMILEGQK